MDRPALVRPLQMFDDLRVESGTPLPTLPAPPFLPDGTIDVHVAHPSLFTCLGMVSPTTFVAGVAFCPCGEAVAREWVAGNTSPRPFYNKRISPLW